MRDNIVYLNSKFLPLDEAHVSVLDRGFLLGDGVYEVIPVYAGRLFRLEQHLQRLDHSLSGIRLNNPLNSDEWHHLLNELVERNSGDDQSIYLQITRGAARRDLAFPTDTPPTVFAMSSPLVIDNSDEQRGIAAALLEDSRWLHCNIKAVTLLPNVLLRQQALDAGAQEAIMVRDGELTEGAASNVFIVHNGIAITPPHSDHLLPGVTRDLVVELCREHAIPCEERPCRREELLSADEIWITSSPKGVVPVVRLDGQPVGDGLPGPLWQRLATLYRAYQQTFRSGNLK